MPGEFGGRNLVRKRKHFRWKNVKYKARMRRHKSNDPLEGAPQAKGIVLEKRGIEQKQPSSGLIKAVRVQLLKNNIQVTAHVPRNHAIEKVNEHDEVTICSIGGSQGGAVGSMAGLKYKVILVNGVDLQQIVSGKKQKPTR